VSARPQHKDARHDGSAAAAKLREAQDVITGMQAELVEERSKQQVPNNGEPEECVRSTADGSAAPDKRNADRNPRRAAPHARQSLTLSSIAACTSAVPFAPDDTT